MQNILQCPDTGIANITHEICVTSDAMFTKLHGTIVYLLCTWNKTS